MLKVAVLGAGYWGTNLIRVFKELDVLKLICDTDKNKLKIQSGKFPDVEITDSVKEVWNDKEIEAVVIATPAVTHYELTKQALLSGKHVFVEKPLALKKKEGEELVVLANDSARVLMVGHILQYHPAVVTLKNLIDKGELGKVEYMYSNRLNIGKLRTEENILWSFAPHDISVMLMLHGAEPVKVSAYGGDYLSRGVYDTTMTNLEFANGAKGHIFVSWLHPFKEQKLVVVGSKAMAVFDDMAKEKLFVYPHKIEWKNGKIPIAHKAEHYNVEVENKEPLKEEAKHFLECILEKKTPKTDAVEGLKVLKVLQKAEESIAPSCSLAIPAKRSSRYFVHPTSFVDDGAEIGEGTKIWHFSHVLKKSKIGKNCVIGQNASIGPSVTIGDNVKIQNNVSVYDGVTLEDDVFCGPSAVFTNVYNPRAFVERKKEFRETLIKKGSSIGANATIVCGVTIGKYAFVGAGAVVKENVPDYGLMVGVPSKQIGWACKCGVTLKFGIDNHAECAYCGSTYSIDGKSIKVIQEKI